MRKRKQVHKNKTIILSLNSLNHMVTLTLQPDRQTQICILNYKERIGALYI